MPLSGSTVKRFIAKKWLFGIGRKASIYLGLASWAAYGIFDGDFFAFMGIKAPEVLATISLGIGIACCCISVIELLLKALFVGGKYFFVGEGSCYKRAENERNFFEDGISDSPNIVEKLKEFGFRTYFAQFFKLWEEWNAHKKDKGIKSDKELYRCWKKITVGFFCWWEAALVVVAVVVLGYDLNILMDFENVNFWKIIFLSISGVLSVIFIFNRMPFLYRLLDIVIVSLCLVNLIGLARGFNPSYESYHLFSAILSQSSPLRDALECPFNNYCFLLFFRLVVDKKSRAACLESFLYGTLNKILVVVGSFVAVALVIASFYNWGWNWLVFVDSLFTFLFMLELGCKVYEEGLAYLFKKGNDSKKNLFLRKYRIDWWNLSDALVIVCSMTSFFMMLDEYRGIGGMCAIILFRLIRVLKLLRILKLFQKDLAHLVAGVKDATLKSIPIISIFVISLFILGFILYFGQVKLGVGGEYFKDPISAIVSLFRLFTYDGWHDIPTKIASECNSIYPGIWWVDGAVRIGFCVLVFFGGIVGVALLNSVFVDGMLGRDKIDEKRLQKLDDLSTKLDELTVKVDAMDSARYKMR